MEYIKNDKLDFLIDLALSENEDMFGSERDYIDAPDVVFSKKYYKTRQRIIRKCKYEPVMRKLGNIASKVAAFAFVIVLAATVAVAAIPPLRHAVLEAVVEWYENYLTIRYQMPEDTDGQEITDTSAGVDSNVTDTPAISDSQGTGDAGQAAVVVTSPNRIEEVRKPTYVPEGVVEDVVLENKFQVIIDYYLNNEISYSFEQMLLKDQNLYVDNENTIINNIIVNGYDAKTVEFLNGNKQLVIVWNDGEYIYEIKSITHDFDYLKVIAESVNK